MMLLMLIQLLTAGIIIGIEPKKDSNRWVALDLALCCIWDLSYILKENAIPYLDSYGLAVPFLREVLFQAHVIMEFTGEILNPYAGLMFAIVYTEVAGKRLKRWLSLLLLAPCVFMLFVTPFRPDLQIDYKLMVWWVGVYYGSILILLIYAVAKAADQRTRIHRMMTASIAIPPMLGDYFFNHLARAINYSSQAYRLLALFFVFSFILFLWFAVRYGVFGVRILFRNQRLDSSLRAVTSGSSLLNHAIKNRLINIEFLSDRIEAAAGGERESNLLTIDSLQHIREEVRILRAMIDRIHKQSQDYEMKKVPEHLPQLLADFFAAQRHRIEARGVELQLSLEPVRPITCDRVHLQELFLNLLTNALEAMEEHRGQLEVRCYERARSVIVEFTDNGCGIEKEQLKSVLDPFFSTKNWTGNYGLGLSYCYTVMLKHNGSIDVHSEKNQGAAVILKFPVKSRIGWETI
jgi:two-component system, NtrC family, sensor kinase